MASVVSGKKVEKMSSVQMPCYNFVPKQPLALHASSSPQAYTLLLLLLHGKIVVVLQANTVPATFWALAFLLLPDNAHHKQQILSVLQSGGSHDNSRTAPAQQQGMDDAGQPPPIFARYADDRSCSPCDCSVCMPVAMWKYAVTKSYSVW